DEQRRGLPLVPLVSLPEFLHGGEDFRKPDRVGVEHRPAAVGREAVAGEVDHVDVGGAQGDAFLEDGRAFVDQRVDQALYDLVVTDFSWGYFYFFSVLRNYFVDGGIGNRLAVAGFVLVEALAGLLTEAALLADAVGDPRIDEVRALLVAALAHFPADVVARHVVHRERAHRHAELRHGGVDLLRARALVDQEQALLAVLL